jgi:membrane-associated phospholipid phosphatase
VVIIAESAVLAVLVDQSVKFIAGRERPFVHALLPDQKLFTANPYDNNLSFFSGHTAFSFAIAVAAGEVAELRGYESAWVAWAVGLPLAAGVGYLRIAADKHYLTDVLTGAAVGAAFGWGVPSLLHGRIDAQVSPTPGGIAISGRF